MRRTALRADASSARRWNEFVVVDSLRTHGPQRISEIGRRTGLTAAPLGHVMRSLQELGWVEVSAPTVQGPGRPAQTYSLSQPRGWVIGLDVGAHATRAVRVDLAGAVHARASVRTNPGGVPDAHHRAVQAVLLDCAPPPGPGEVWLTMLAVGGHLEPGGRVVRSIAIPEWDGLHPLDIFTGTLPSRASVVNDVRAATWAEHAVGAARGFEEVLVAQLGRRPTLGLLLGGLPRRGAHGTAGDMSLNPFLPSEEHMQWLEPFAGSPDPLGDAVADALRGNEATLAGACGYVELVTPSLALAASVVDPAIFVVAGALAPLSKHFLDPLRHSLRAHLLQPPEVVISPLDQFSTALGAALLGLRKIVDTLASPMHGVAPFTLEEFSASELS